ncbi:MAG: toll/interleukin-1 receptor domain-containing protein [Gammaproteobacteria bacterium]
MSEKHYDVFVSYSREDKPWVSEFVSASRSGSAQAWFDVADVEPGENWQDKIQEALRESTTLVIILSPNSVDTPRTFFEIGAAVAGKKRIIPVLLEDVDMRQVPAPLRKFQALRGSSPTEAGRRVAEILENAAMH